jgi:hypothetical protein
MSVTKPSAYPLWATGGSAQIVVPSGAKTALGWIIEKPPFQFFNYLFNLIGQWFQWIDQGYKPMTAVIASGAATISPALGASVDYAIDCTLGNQSVALPTPGSPTDNGMMISILRLDASSNTITWTGTVSGQVNPTLVNQYTRESIIAYNGLWYWNS